MPENNTSTANNVIPQEIAVSQLGVEVPYKQHKITKGRNLPPGGRNTLRVDVDKLNDEQKLILIGGQKGLQELVNKTIISRGYGYFNEAMDEDEFNLDLFKTLASGAVVAGETLEDLYDNKSELQEEVMAIMQAQMDSQDMKLTTEQEARVKEISSALKDIQEAIRRKEEIGAKRAAARKANAESKAAPAKTVAPVTA